MDGSPNDYLRYLSSGRGGSTPRSRGGGSTPRQRSTPPTPGGSFTGSPPVYYQPSPPVNEQSPPVHQQSPAVHQQAPPPHVPGDMTVDQLLLMPGRDRLPRLDPARPAGTLWFNDDGSVAAQIRTIFERDFKEVHPNFSLTPKHVVDRWFNTFAQYYHWDPSNTKIVRQGFEAKLKERMCDQVGRWKKKWENIGDDAMPRWFDAEVWAGLVAYWQDPQSLRKSLNSRAARLSDPDGDGPHKHRSGQTSFRARARQIAARSGSDSVPDLVAVLAETKRRPDGTFVDGRSEKLYDALTSKMQELTQNSSGEDSTASVALTPQQKNKIFTEVAPRKKGRIFGVGSLQSNIEACTGASSTSSSYQSETAVLRDQIHAQGEQLHAAQEKIVAYENIFSYLATKDPQIADMMSRVCSKAPPSDPASDDGTGPSSTNF